MLPSVTIHTMGNDLNTSLTQQSTQRELLTHATTHLVSLSKFSKTDRKEINMDNIPRTHEGKLILNIVNIHLFSL